MVLDDAGGLCLGLVRLADVASWSNPGNRILGDLVGPITPMTVKSDEEASDVAALFATHALGEAVVVGANDRYIGLITSESVLAWTLKELELGSTPAKPVTGSIPPDVLDKGIVSGVRPSRAETARWILVVEDHAASRWALAAILRKRDYQVSECATIQEALGAAAKQRFALVISDLELPDGSGFGLMKELQQLYGLRGIAVSGLSLDCNQTQSRSAGFSFYLRKPIVIRDLEAAMHAILRESSDVVS
ncbi:MAG: response regulator [Opitutus sp.]